MSYDDCYFDQDEEIPEENKIVEIPDEEEEKLETAEEIYLKLKNYCDFHGLNFLDKDSSLCITNLINLM